MTITTPKELYLFRYRDLNAETIVAHRAIIATHQSCWWGWWKRPAEPARAEVWSDLASQIAERGHAIVALYDSGTAIARLATVKSVITPKPGVDGRPEPVFPPQKNLVPKYYRQGQFCRAWLELTEISDVTLELFSDWSYATAPPIPGLNSSQLDELAGKRIASSHELASMDTTIWHIRRAHEHDRTGSFLTPQMRVRQPISSTPVVCPGEWILHLTDLHYATGVDRDRHAWPFAGEGAGGQSTALEAIGKSIRASNRSVGFVLVTGDLTFKAAADEFNQARTELFRFVTGDLGLPLDNLAIVPGNHDIKWSTDEQYAPGAKVDNAPEAATKPYRDFFQQLFRFVPSPALSMGRRLVFPNGAVVDIGAVNSSTLEQGHDFLAGMGRVSEDTISDLIQTFGWAQNGSGLRLLALHHHLALVEDLAAEAEFYSGFGIAVDAPRILRLAARNGVSLAVHGHRHTPFLGRVYAHELPDTSTELWDLGSINILGGGSAASSDVRDDWNHFNLLRYDGSKLTSEIYRSHKRGMFTLLGAWTAAVDHSSGSLGVQLEKWERRHHAPNGLDNA